MVLNKNNFFVNFLYLMRLIWVKIPKNAPKVAIAVTFCLILLEKHMTAFIYIKVIYEKYVYIFIIIIITTPKLRLK